MKAKLILILKTKHLFSLFFLMTCFAYKSNSQIDPQFTQYMFLNPFINPGATGINNNTEAALVYRNQWSLSKPTSGDLSGAPVDELATYSTKIQSINSGIGGYVLNDQLGPLSNYNIKLNYAYHFEIGPGKLGVGVGAGLYSAGFDKSKLNPNDPGDPYIAALSRKTSLDFNAGLFYYTPTYYFGISSSHLTDNNGNITNATISMKDTSHHLVSNRSYYITGGYNFQLNDLFTFSPSFLLKNSSASFTTTSIDLSALMKYNNDQFWGGLAFRSGDAASVLIGIGLLKDHSLRVGYAFDLVVIGNTAKSGTSHEFMVTYSKPVPSLLPKPIIRTPRYRF